MTPSQVILRLNEVTKLQADVISELYLLLMQHISAEDAEALAVSRKINEAAEIRAELEREI